MTPAEKIEETVKNLEADIEKLRKDLVLLYEEHTRTAEQIKQVQLLLGDYKQRLAGLKANR